MPEHEHSWAFEPRHNRDKLKAEGMLYTCLCGAQLHRWPDGTEAVQLAMPYRAWQSTREWTGR